MGFTGYIDDLFKETNDTKMLHKRGSIKKKHKTKKCKKGCTKVCKISKGCKGCKKGCKGCKGCKKRSKGSKGYKKGSKVSKCKSIPKRSKSKYSNKKSLKRLPARYSYYM